jgi:hypothetical protein
MAQLSVKNIGRKKISCSAIRFGLFPESIPISRPAETTLKNQVSQ